MHTSTVLLPQRSKMVTHKAPTVADNRREHLRRIIKDQFNNSPQNLAAELGYANGSFLVQMAGPNPSRPVSEKTARKIEKVLGLADGVMDRPPQEEAAQPQQRVVEMSRGAARAAAGPSPMVGADTPLIGDVVRMVGQVAEDEHITLPPTKLADLVALAWTDTLEHDGKPREDFVRRIVKLAKS